MDSYNISRIDKLVEDFAPPGATYSTEVKNLIMAFLRLNDIQPKLTIELLTLLSDKDILE